MKRAETRTIERLAGLFLLGVVLFNYPLLSLFNLDHFIFNIPVLYLYIFGSWLGLIGLTALITARSSRLKPQREDA